MAKDIDHPVIHSFDVFDTIITRDVIQPHHIFLKMQLTMKRAGPDLPRPLIDEFPEIRIAAEHRARRSQTREEISLEDIYDDIRKAYSLDPQTVRLLTELEIRTEFDAILPIRWTRDEIVRLRSEGKRVVLISDMYLSKATIESFLKKTDFDLSDIPFYLSREAGLTKYTGNLFRHVLKKEGCLPGHLYHCGDNPYSDIFIPHRLGIQLHFCPQEEQKQALSNARYHARFLKQGFK